MASRTLVFLLILLVSLGLVSCGKKGGGFIPPSPFGPPPEPEEPEVALRVPAVEWASSEFLESGI